MALGDSTITLGQLVTYQVCQFLWKEIIFNDPIKNIVLSCPRSAWQGLPPSKSLFRQPPGQGIAIGNLTSQLLSNVYLDQLDRYVTFNLGFKHYGRYVVDFYIVHQDKDRLVKAITDISKYLKSDLKLKLHPKKQYLQECHKGVPFLGAVIYPHRIHPGSHLRRNLLVALKDGNSSVATYFSYTGLVGHYRHKRLLEGIKAPVGV